MYVLYKKFKSARFASRPFCSAKQSDRIRYLHAVTATVYVLEEPPFLTVTITVFAPDLHVTLDPLVMEFPFTVQTSSRILHGNQIFTLYGKEFFTSPYSDGTNSNWIGFSKTRPTSLTETYLKSMTLIDDHSNTAKPQVSAQGN